MSHLPPATSKGRLEDYFLEAAARYPDRLAMHCGELELTYRQAARAAHRLAARLVAAGVGRERVVGLVMDRGATAMVASLAVHLAGGAFLPLSPDLPPERLDYIMSDARPMLLIAAPGQLPVARRTGVQSWEWAPDPADEDAGPDEDEVVDRRGQLAEDLAWIIYTSGSTGVPKAVQVTHAGVRIVAEAQSELMGLVAEDRILQLASPSFDASIFEMLMAFTSGGALFTPESVGEADRDLAGYLRTHGITVGLIPPAALPSVGDPAHLPRLRMVIVAGDVCPPPVAGTWLDRQLWNFYGPTETTVVVTGHPITAQDVRDANIPIGSSLRQVPLYVLDDRLDQVADGADGELYVGGLGLARGYLNSPVTTARRFVPDPFTSRAGARMYRTGDRCVRGPDGVVRFLGRLDRQVKIRSFRVELDEVELSVRKSGAVRDTVVVARDDPSGAGKRLVAYVVAERSPLEHSALRRELTQRLPAHMVPSLFVELSRLPVTVNGKVDRDALPEVVPAAGQEADARPAGLPGAVAGLWAEVLGVSPAAGTDDFFSLGGHSLAATRLLGMLRARYGQQVPSGIVYDHPVLDALVDALRELGVADSPDAPVRSAALAPIPRRRSPRVGST
ncbi:non-ribosomal peptide synthetase [Jatrophihabitans sp.]|jgi:amino acid adenylation domain-containing protein|uniref:non-ribosomal peptide synthetase n=1 Tax=Jatrophihabitans sp. TaxID=1932789 RepID=UPI002F24EFC4